MLQSGWMDQSSIGASRRPRIALVEDSPADAHIFRFALQQTGISLDIDVLEDGFKAMEYLCAGNGHGPRCDLVLLDLNLPGMSGFEVLERIKAVDQLRRVPVVVMSGSSSHEDIDRCYLAGANSYVSKPSQLEDILEMAGRLVAYWFDCAKLPNLDR